MNTRLTRAELKAAVEALSAKLAGAMEDEEDSEVYERAHAKLAAQLARRIK
jgi:hypothetical protein